MDDKVYHPEEIVENPFPGEVEAFVPQAQSGSKDTYSPTVSKEKPLPVKKIATELLSTALNTRSKKILQEFELQQTGGFKVGDFKKGISGDVRITPNGVTARDKAGITTFAIDGSDGSAVFKGTIQAGALIGGNGKVVVEESANGGGRIVMYDGDLPSILIGDAD